MIGSKGLEGPARVAAFATISAALSSAVYLIFSALQGTDVQLGDTLVSTAAGGIAGLLLQMSIDIEEIRRAQSGAKDDLFASQALLRRPFQLLELGQRHGRTLQRLLVASVDRECRSIPHTDKNSYRGFLMAAIADAGSYRGIKTGTISSFQTESSTDTSVATYLGSLKARKMPGRKVRVFVITRSDVSAMETQLADPETLAAYWDLTGSDVETFWVTIEDVSDNGWTVPPDCAVYDHELFISYDERRQTLTFDVLVADGGRDGILQLFQQLDSQVAVGGVTPFRPVPKT